ncbi:ATP-binding protein [Micromonospora sp. ATA51]|uniref:ATP-binding protein n=1 Tax=Micromonospora sp. ATA51 TaxID=2806098 RepID=UPI001A574608|nr:ATP-binding protein [Micromonospora sp. ATA51]MBM0227080.1 MEDS domain-containing protein [Micromonospora sp. ATA51]
MTGPASPVARDFVHAALIVDSEDALRARLVPALRRSVAAHERVHLLVGAHVERVLRDALGTVADRLEWGESATFHLRLGFAYERLRRYLAAQHAAGSSVHVITEADVSAPERDAPVDRATAHLSYESACGDAYADYGCAVTCLWDSRRHPTPLIESVRTLHNHELTDSGCLPNSGHVGSADYLRRISEIPLAAVPTMVDLDVGLVALDQLNPLRAALRGWAEARSFDADATGDVVVAVTEVATNGLVHGALPVRLRCWHHGDTLIVQVDDSGDRPIPPTAGFRGPGSADRVGGRGLWLARQLADVVTMHCGESSTSVRLHFPHVGTHGRPAGRLTGPPTAATPSRRQARAGVVSAAVRARPGRPRARRRRECWPSHGWGTPAPSTVRGRRRSAPGPPTAAHPCGCTHRDAHVPSRPHSTSAPRRSPRDGISTGGRTAPPGSRIGTGPPPGSGRRTGQKPRWRPSGRRTPPRRRDQPSTSRYCR